MTTCLTHNKHTRKLDDFNLITYTLVHMDSQMLPTVQFGCWTGCNSQFTTTTKETGYTMIFIGEWKKEKENMLNVALVYNTI